MKTTIINFGISITLAALLFTGCSSGSDDKDTEVAYANGTVKYENGTVFGVTKAEQGQNGGFDVYDNTGNIIGFIQLDGKVTDANGLDLGVCQNITISENGLSGDCTVPTNPVVITTTTTPTPSPTTTTTPTPTPTTTTTTPTPTTTTSTDNNNAGGIVEDGEITSEQLTPPDRPQPTCSNIQPHLLPACTGAAGEVPAN